MYFRTIPPLAMLITLVLSSCGSSEIERLRAENDSLRHELENRLSMVTVMNDVKSLLDSIDENRNVLHMDLKEGTTHDNFQKRLSSINDYVKKTTDKLSSIEKELKSSQHENTAYEMMVSALKDELHIRVEEVQSLEKAVDKYKTENKGLIQMVKLQQDELSEMQSKINVKQQELSLLQAKVDELVENFKVSEAEAYYARAKSVEEAARRTRLAPHKKRETYRESLELYKKAFSLGKVEAKANIEALEKKVN
jgi:chromosome segregation ATPase